MSGRGAASRAVARWLAALAVRACAIFHRMSRTEGVIPSGPVLLAANHNNMLIDPLLVMGAAGRRVRPIVKSPHFKTPIFSWVLKGIGALPVYRQQDDARRLARNRSTLDRISAALEGGDAVLVFPEGGSEAGRRLRPLKAGTARVALATEADANWRLGVRVVPIGIALSCPRRFRSLAVVGIAPPMAVADWREAYRADPAEAVRELTGELRAGIEGALRNAWDRLEVLQAAERVERTSGLELARWLAGLPLAGLGTAAWLLPVAASGLAPILGRTEPTTISTVKLLTAIVAFPVTYAAWLLAALLVAGPPALALAAVGLPLLAAYSVGWHDRRRRIVSEWRGRRADGAEAEVIR